MQKYQQCFDRFSPDSRILDIGCGVGDLTARMAKKAPQGLVLGVDLRYQELAQAALRYPSSRHPRMRAPFDSLWNPLTLPFLAAVCTWSNGPGQPFRPLPEI